MDSFSWVKRKEGRRELWWERNALKSSSLLNTANASSTYRKYANGLFSVIFCEAKRSTTQHCREGGQESSSVEPARAVHPVSLHWCSVLFLLHNFLVRNQFTRKRGHRFRNVLFADYLLDYLWIYVVELPRVPHPSTSGFEEAEKAWYVSLFCLLIRFPHNNL